MMASTGLPVNIDSVLTRVAAGVQALSDQARRWEASTDDDLFAEVCACILGSQVTYSTASRAAQHLREQGYLRVRGIKDFALLEDDVRRALMAVPLDNGRFIRYRFPIRGAVLIRRAAEYLHHSEVSLRDHLYQSGNGVRVRAYLARHIPGIGPKQASLFLRNVQYANDIAVLDHHVLRFMMLRGLCVGAGYPSGLREYEAIEASLRAYSATLGVPVGHLDLAIWATMRVMTGGQ